MMEEWGIPSLYLHSTACEYASILASGGGRVPDPAFAGGFSAEVTGVPYLMECYREEALKILRAQGFSPAYKKEAVPAKPERRLPGTSSVCNRV
jgi:hypothetical protein